MADQMAPQLSGAYGHKIVKTPNLEKLCGNGVRFDAAYTNSPICAPARAAMLTGKYISRIGTHDNGVNFPADIPTLAHALRLEGYEVVASGKMHYLGGDQLHGLERRLTQDVYPAGFKWIHDWEAERTNGIKNDKGFLVEPGKTGLVPWSNQLNFDEETQFRALEYVRRKFYTTGAPRKSQKRPFCLIVSYTQPHSPYCTVKKYWDLYNADEIQPPEIRDGYEKSEIIMDRWLRDYEGIDPELMKDEEAMKQLRRSYFGMISYIDKKVGELLECLENFNLLNTTAVIFASDHGDMVGERGFIEKRVFYEYSSRVPLICSFLGTWTMGKHVKEPVSLVDVLPTLLDLAGAEFPFQIDGKSFIGHLKPGSTGEKDRIAISEYLCEGVLSPCFMVRKGKFKYIHVHEHDSQLFNLGDDPHELNNLSGKPRVAEIENELRDIILNTFDCDQIERDVRDKQKRCRYIHQAMMRGVKTMWDMKPNPDDEYKYDQ